MATDLGASVSQGESVGLGKSVVPPETANAIEVRQVSEENQGDKSSGITADEEIGNATREDYRKSVTKVIGMLEEMKQQMERLPDMSKPEYVKLYHQLSSIDTSQKSISNELHFIREWMEGKVGKEPPPESMNAGVVIHASAGPPGPMGTGGGKPGKQRESTWRRFLGFK